MNFETIKWTDAGVVIIDQTKLPAEFVERTCTTVEDMHDAIRILAVRGAPLLGVAAAYGLCLGIKTYAGERLPEFMNELESVVKYIKSSRPTAVNLFWALERMLAKARSLENLAVSDIKAALLEEAHAIKEEDRALCRGIGESGESLIEDGDVLLTHCNAGALATAGIGTALAPMYVAHEKGRQFKVYADETRPLLQGSRLTCFELRRNGIDVTVQCDNMAATLMKKGIITKIITGTDRVAANGDAANKIGTYTLAVLAKHHGIPFYIASPYSTFDFDCPDGDSIPIEERDGNELYFLGDKQIAPTEVKTYNPAFDVTPHELITAFITEKGVFSPDEIGCMRK